MPTVSVILPVFNAADYLPACIESVLSQSFSDFELIIVDDGSTDDSYAICCKYKSQDSRIKAIHQENRGVSAARNKALSISEGQYIAFIDSDDTYLADTIEKLYDNLINSKSQICICDAFAIVDSEHKEIETIDSLSGSCTLEKKHISPKVLLEIAGAVWRCLYDASIIRENNLMFPNGLKLAEDRIFNIYAMGLAERICYLKEPLYNRMLLDGSAVHRFHKDYFSTVKLGRKATRKALSEAWHDDPDFQTEYLSQFIYGALMAIENIKHPDSHVSFRKRWREIAQICSDKELQEAIEATSYSGKDPRVGWIRNKCIALLMMKSLKPYWQYQRVKKLLSIEGICRIFKRIR